MKSSKARVERPNITHTEKTLGYLLRESYEALAKEVYSRLNAAGFSEVRRAHSSVLRSISPDGSRIVDLASGAQMRKQSMGELVAYLQEHGYVDTKPDPEDARARLVFLTKRGEKLQQTVLTISKAVEREVAEAIGLKALSQLRVALEKLVEIGQR